MKALSIKMPWAHLIASGQKSIEVRTWATQYRGELLICASKAPDLTARPLHVIIGPTSSMWRRSDCGHAIAKAELAYCRPMTKDDEDKALCDFIPGLWSWILEDVRPIEPFPVKGMLGLFEVVVP